MYDSHEVDELMNYVEIITYDSSDFDDADE